MIPKDSKFKRELRNVLMKNNPYARHWVDAVIRTAYSITDSWRKRIARVSWRNIVRETGQRVIIKEVNPKDTSKTCSRCRFKVKDLRGRSSDVLDAV